MSGDEIVRKATVNATRAITIDTAPAMVWPWMCRWHRRAGFYTYDLLDKAGPPASCPSTKTPRSGTGC